MEPVYHKGNRQILNQEKNIYGGKIIQIWNRPCFILYLFVYFPIYVYLFISWLLTFEESRLDLSL